MSVTSEDLERIASEVWSNVLACEATAAEMAAPGELTGTIQITGAFRGAVVVKVPRDLARSAAATMFALDLGAIGDGEERDALGELTNMVGGHVKAMVPSVSQLALPTVVSGDGHNIKSCVLELLAERAMTAGGHNFLIQVYEIVG